MPCQIEVPAWLAVAAPFATLLAALGSTTLVIEAGWLDAVCDGALRGSVNASAAEAVEVVWCDMRGAGYSLLRHVT